MEWLVVSSLAFFIGAMVWVAYDISFRQNNTGKNTDK
jgi:hypothetical protein